jgi:hypothetical protein
MPRAIAFALTLSLAIDAHAADGRALNIGAQAIVTVVSGYVQGHCRGRDLWRCLTAGAVAGYGFYEAKNMVSHNDVTAGWLVANVAASLSENVAAGKHPLAQVGYSLGPVRVRVPICRFDPRADSYVYVDASLAQTVAMWHAMGDNDSMHLRRGMIMFERDSPYPASDGGTFDGYTWGMFPGVAPAADRELWHHEIIHAVQSLQAQSVEPSLRILTYTPPPPARKRFVRFEHLHLGVIEGLNSLATDQQSYEDRWNEIEAYDIAQDVKPPRRGR